MPDVGSRSLKEWLRRPVAALGRSVIWLGRRLHISSALRITVLAGVLIALVVINFETLRERYDAIIMAVRGDVRGGLILIETPQIYTRERLVNDRFREAAWLQELLLDTEKLVEAGRFRQPQLVLRSDSGVQIRVGPSAPPAPLQDNNQSASNGTAAPAISEATPLDEFEDVVRYREAIRNAFMEMQLDDRHDIAGNTIYRLNFQTIVVPERGARKLAAITVKLSESLELRWREERYSELLEDWRDELQRQVSALVDDRVETIERGFYLPPVEQARLDDFLSHEQTRYELNSVVDRFLEMHLTKHHEGIDASAQSFFGGSLDPKSLSRLRYDLCARAPEIPLDSFPTDFPIAGRTGTFFCQYPRANARLVAQLDLVAAMRLFYDDGPPVIRRCFDQNALPFITSVVLGTPGVGPNGGTEGSNECHREAERLFAVRRQLGEPALRHAVVSTFIAHDLTELEAKTIRRPRLGQFFEFSAAHCQKERCYPEVVLRTTLPERNDCNPGSLPNCLIAYLEHDAQVATYTVTPSKAAQRLGVLERQVVTLDGGAGFWAGSGVSALEAASLEREPIVMSIGDWGEVTTSDAGRGAEQEQSSSNIVTKFAWIALPRRQASNLGRATQHPDHVSMSAVVSVPSWWKSLRLKITTCWLPPDGLPEMIAPDDLCENVPGGGTKTHFLDVAVPGDASELMHKLRFEVLTFPYVLRQPFGQVLEVGRPGTLTILGGRLWRSPTVIMGSDVASRIEVLPDMKGIIAHFECVKPHPGTPGTLGPPPLASPASPASTDKLDVSDTRILKAGTRIATAVIWTSEGRTAPVEVELRPFVRRAGEQTDEPCWLNPEKSIASEH